MNKLSKTLVGLGLVFVGFSSISIADEAKWGGAELKTASAAALDHFKEMNGQALFDSVVSVNLEINSQGNAARAKITYAKDGEKKVASLFCHVHEGEGIDCH